MDSKRKKYYVNWNLISLCATVIVIVLGIALGYPQKELSLLQTELEKAEREKIELENQIDPEWHNRLNQLSTHYEYMLKRKDDTINFSNEKIDSLRMQFNIIQRNDSNQVVLNEIQEKRMLIAFMKVNAQDSLIYNYEQLIENQKSLDKNLRELIKIKDEYIDSLIKARSKRKTYDLISIVVAFLIISIILYDKIKNRKKTNI